MIDHYKPPLLTHFKNIVLALTTYEKTPQNGRILTRAMALYMERQALMQYYPEIHWRMDMESFMATQRDSWNLIEYRLEDAEIEGYEAWLERENLTLTQALNYCAEKLIKVSFTYSDKDANWCVSLTGQKDNRFNSGNTLTNWSDDAVDAFMMGIYKVTVIFEDGKWQTRKSSRRG